jgi:ferrous iron transport protein A
MKLCFSHLQPGDRVRLIDFGSTDTAYRRKLLSFGLTRGVELSVVRVAPLGCPVQLEVRGAAVALRKDEAQHLVWERL